ncbi:MAG: YvcK family protein [Bacilli bacterium]|nr:YvcK family protein [Bacilli bacterium]
MNKKIVVLGGGTGLSVLLRGLKEFPLDITAIVAVSDDDSSTGRLRKEFNIPALGDLRNVIVALSEVEPTLEKLLQYRFNTNSDLNGHPVGNLLLTALLNIKGNLVDAISALSNILKLKGEVLPLTEDCVTLIAETEDNKVLIGESNITKAGKKIKKIYYKERPIVVPKVIDAINSADLIIFGSGSLYTSILPNILCDEMKDAIIKSPAKKMYICNIMTEHGETDGFKVSDYINVINKYIGKDILDVVIANNKEIEEKIKTRYRKLEKSDPVLIDEENIKTKLIKDNLVVINEEKMVRHNHMKTAFLIYSYLME